MASDLPRPTIVSAEYRRDPLQREENTGFSRPCCSYIAWLGS
jgi:hypothetical protein